MSGKCSPGGSKEKDLSTPSADDANDAESAGVEQAADEPSAPAVVHEE